MWKIGDGIYWNHEQIIEVVKFKSASDNPYEITEYSVVTKTNN